MASEYHRLLDPQPISASKSQDLTLAFDAGAYRQLNLAFSLLAAGAVASGTFTVTVQHASINDDGAYTDLKDDSGNTVQLALTGTEGVSYFRVGGFLRFVRFNIEASDTINTPAIAGIDLVAKE